MNTAKLPIAIVSLEWDIVDLIESIDAHRIVGFFDARRDCATREFRYLGTDDAWPKILEDAPDLKIALAIDNPEARRRLFDHYGGSAIVRLQSPHAHVTDRASIGHGSIVQRGVTVMPYAQVDVGCKLNVNCTIHHEARIGAFTTLAPGSQILGNVTIAERVYVGAGAVIRQRCRIGEGAVIGAGAVVVADVPAGTTVVGVPAKRRLR
jgi:sugar O-acyltransferase (sialic acid O-acetyltransferase NeuD family)